MLVVWPGGVLPSEAGREGHGNMPGDGKKQYTSGHGQDVKLLPG